MMLMAVPMLPNPDTSSADRPVVRAVAGRKRRRGQRRVRPPADVWRVAGAVQSVCRPRKLK